MSTGTVAEAILLSAIVAGTAIERPTNEEWKKQQQAKKDAAGADGAKDAKMAAVNKVIKSMMLECHCKLMVESPAIAASPMAKLARQGHSAIWDLQGTPPCFPCRAVVWAFPRKS